MNFKKARPKIFVLFYPLKLGKVDFRFNLDFRVVFAVQEGRAKKSKKRKKKEKLYSIWKKLRNNLHKAIFSVGEIGVVNYEK